MASGNAEEAAQVKFELGAPQHADESLDEVNEFRQPSPLAKNPPSPSPSLPLRKTPLNEQTSAKRRYARQMSGVNVASVGARTMNVNTPQELCDLLGGSRVINKVQRSLRAVSEGSRVLVSLADSHC